MSLLSSPYLMLSIHSGVFCMQCVIALAIVLCFPLYGNAIVQSFLLDVIASAFEQFFFVTVMKVNRGVQASKGSLSSQAIATT